MPCTSALFSCSCHVCKPVTILWESPGSNMQIFWLTVNSQHQLPNMWVNEFFQMSPFLSNWDNPSFWIFPVEPEDILRERKLICVITLPKSWPTEYENNKIFAALNFKILIDMHFYGVLDNWNTYPLKRKNKLNLHVIQLY